MERERRFSHFFYALRQGLGRPLFASFILLALIPLIIASWISYQHARSSLLEKEIKNLTTALSLRGLYFETYFQERLNDLVIQSDLNENIHLLETLREQYLKSGKSLPEFITSYIYITTATEHSQDLQDFHERAGCANIFLIDIQGNILFSVMEQEFLGVNIFSDPFRDNALARLCRLALKTGRPLSSDLTSFNPGGREDALYTAQLMVDGTGNEIGFLVMQIDLQAIDSIMSNVDGLGNTGQVFLVGNDLLLRSTPRSNTTQKPLVTSVNNPLVEEWLVRERIRHTPGYEEKRKTLAPGDHTGELYTGLSGNRVLGISEDMDSLGQYDMHWLMIAEVEEAEVLVSARHLQQMLLVIVGVTSAFIFLLAGFLTRQITRPIISLTSWAKELSTGKLSLREIQLPSNEIGTLYQALSDMVRALRELIALKDKQDWFNTGETGLFKEISGRSDIAELGERSLNYLCRYLNLPVAVFFTFGDTVLFAEAEGRLKLTAGYAYPIAQAKLKEFAVGQGMVGQAALDKKTIHLENIAPEQSDLAITSGLSVVPVRAVLVVPLLNEGTVLGVLEFGAQQTFTDEQINFLEKVSESLAGAIHSSQSHTRMQALLQQTQEQAAQLKQQQQILEERNRKIEQASQYKTEFLANMSHELRTPLNSILLISNIVARNKNNTLSQEDLESIKIIHKAGTDLLKLINEVLDLAKIEAGHMEIEIAEVQTARIVRHMKELFLPACQQKDLSFEVVINEDMPHSFQTDQQRLEQLLINFLSNSIKFTQKGSIILKLGRVKDLTAQLKAGLPEVLRPEQNLAFTVIDSGVGIDSEKQELIFEAFQQADGSTGRHYGGTGLGLSISREIAEMLGGYILLTSKPGQGSSFVFVHPEKLHPGAVEKIRKSANIAQENQKTSSPLPVQADEGENRVFADDTRRDTPVKVAGLQGKKILLADHDMRTVFSLRKLLSSIGIVVIIGKNGKEALEQLEKHQDVDLILMEMMMPVMDGYECLQAIRASELFNDLPVIATTAKAMPGDREQCLDAGADDYLPKPIAQEKLFAKMSLLLAE